MACTNHQHAQFPVFDLVDNAVVANPYPVLLKAAQFLRTRGTWIFSETVYRSANAGLDVSRKSRYLTLGSSGDKDQVGHASGTRTRLQLVPSNPLAVLLRCVDRLNVEVVFVFTKELEVKFEVTRRDERSDYFAVTFKLKAFAGLKNAN